MQPGPIVTDTTCLIGLEASGRLGLLEQLYGGQILVPPAVTVEWLAAPPAWMSVRPVQDRSLVQSLEVQLGPGESEAIVLALEESASLIVLDDAKARRIATSLKLPVTGTLGVVLLAKQAGLIPTVKKSSTISSELDFICRLP